MNDLQILCINITPDIVALMILSFLYFLVSRNEMISKEKTRFFKLTICSMKVVVILELITVLCEDRPQSWLRIIHITANVMGFSITPLVCMLMAITFNEKIMRKINIFIWPIVIYIFLCIQSSYSGLIFSVSQENHYTRGPLFFLNIIISTYTFCIYLYSRKQMDEYCDRQERLYLNAVYILIIMGSVLQIVFASMHTIWCANALGVLLYYIFVRELELKYDSLTRFKNYRFFIAHLEELSKEQEFIMIVVEAENLNEVNEKLGFLEGDCYIRDAAKVINDTFQNVREIFRLTGGTFCVVMQHKKEAGVKHCIQHMKIKAKKYTRKGIPLTIKCGYEFYQRDENAASDSNREAVRHCFYSAQQKMYQDKSNCIEMIEE